MNYAKIKNTYDNYVNNNNPLGYEIKCQRLKRNLTLTTVSYHIVHYSYLSKAENNQAQLNDSVAKDVCQRVEITQEQIVYIKNSKGKIEEAFSCYMQSDITKLKSLEQEGEGLLNYIYRNIEALYYLSLGELYEAKEIIDEINMCMKSIPVYDLKYICATGIIYDFTIGRFSEALKGIEILETMDINYVFDALAKLIKYKILLIQNDPKFYKILDYFKYNDSIKRINGLYEKAFYYYELSCLKINKNYQIEKYRYYFYPTYYRNLEIFKDFLNGKIKTIPTDKTPIFIRCLYEYQKNKCNTDSIANLNSYIIDVDYSKVFIDYLFQEDERKLDFIFDSAISIVKSTNSYFLKDFFIKEVAKLAEKYKRYKMIFDIYKELY